MPIVVHRLRRRTHSFRPSPQCLRRPSLSSSQSSMPPSSSIASVASVLRSVSISLSSDISLFLSLSLLSTAAPLPPLRRLRTPLIATLHLFFLLDLRSSLSSDLHRQQLLLPLELGLQGKISASPLLSVSGCVLVKIASGAFSGAFATALTNPVEVLKVRLQMNPNLRRGAIGEMRKIASEEGITALWKGVGPAMTTSQLATYDESKWMKTRSE
ncbi:mitochondrial uncoupling protein 3-like [Camellia sinensis]|uniref:mitochondrial uncoupling protein 3-like n=1 Tax=Camellia sinensis TaxID=4442 RepID=UPI00103606A1|nr:mitochondrial uncoupling protein 3-like [Camellia sinensis]